MQEKKRLYVPEIESFSQQSICVLLLQTEYTRCPEREEAALKGFENDDF